MIYLYLIVLVFGYLVVGSVIGSLADFDEDWRIISILFWPLLIVIFIAALICIGLTKLGDNIVYYLKVSVFEPIGKQLEIWFSKEEKEND